MAGGGAVRSFDKLTTGRLTAVRRAHGAVGMPTLRFVTKCYLRPSLRGAGGGWWGGRLKDTYRPGHEPGHELRVGGADLVYETVRGGRRGDVTAVTAAVCATSALSHLTRMGVGIRFRLEL